MAKSLNKVMLIGNLTRDPELRFTANDKAVCSFGLATNRSWVNPVTKEKVDSVEFHNIVAWGKLAEVCNSMLHKGDKAFIEGRIQTQKWLAEDQSEKKRTEIIAENMILIKSVNGFPQDSEDEVEVEATTDEEVTQVEDVSDDVPF